VREDYSPDGDAWSFFSHDQARSRAYRWGQDGIAGISDDEQRLCLALALWNGRDPILKERYFGVTNAEGNHGEDVKEQYFYVDGTPTHSYMRMVYKYPQAEYPYADLVATNRSRGRHDFEYELLDAGAFGDSRYFDVVVEHAKATPNRSAPLHTGGCLDQADGTAWMALYCQNMLQLSLELAVEDPVYVEQAQVFFEHFAGIMVAVNHSVDGASTMWDEEDGFFYDLLRRPDGTATRLKVRSLVGLLPLAAATVFDPQATAHTPELLAGVAEFIEQHPTVEAVVSGGGRSHGKRDYALLSFLDESKLLRVPAIMLDESEFLSPYGIRSVSRRHAGRPFGVDVDGQRYEVAYLPAESDTGMFGGNSNWRGPIWFPLNFCYDKRLYDRLVHEDAAAVRQHLSAGVDYQSLLLRFIENHDEPRAAAVLSGGRDRAAAVAVATLLGAPLWHDGQLTGRRVPLPVFLARRPDEPPNDDLRLASVGHPRACAGTTLRRMNGRTGVSAVRPASESLRGTPRGSTRR
jgi:hypothetical protein